MTSNGQGTDITLGWVDTVNCAKGCVNDYWTTAQAKPNYDSSQDVNWIDGFTENQYTVIQFYRYLDTGEIEDTSLNLVTNILWATHTSSDPSSSTTFSQHTNKGVSNYNFLSPKCKCYDPSYYFI